MDNKEFRYQLKGLRKNKNKTSEELIEEARKLRMQMSKLTQESLKMYKITLRKLGEKKPKVYQESAGENKIKKWLQKNKVLFIQEKEFEDLVNPITSCNLRFDFYLPEKNTVIEFDGKQHFEKLKFDKTLNDFENRRYRDNLKDLYCQERNIKLIRIPYTQFLEIPLVLTDNL